jgi:hypothetical protein
MALTTKAAHRKDLRNDRAKMEHRHFAAIAAVIRDMGTAPVDSWTQTQIAGQFAAALRSTNPRFDRDRFMRACLHKDA